jgi:hypothetical protein
MGNGPHGKRTKLKFHMFASPTTLLRAISLRSFSKPSRFASPRQTQQATKNSTSSSAAAATATKREVPSDNDDGGDFDNLDVEPTPSRNVQQRRPRAAPTPTAGAPRDSLDDSGSWRGQEETVLRAMKAQLLEMESRPEGPRSKRDKMLMDDLVSMRGLHTLIMCTYKQSTHNTHTHKMHTLTIC